MTINIKAQVFDWAKTLIGSVDGYAISTDSEGSYYISGGFNGTAIFGATQLVSNGFYGNIFLAKFDSNGNFIWAQKAGGTGVSRGTAITTDNAGNSYITGIFTGTATFGTNQITSSGEEDIFIAKYDFNGNFLWVQKAGGTHFDRAYGISSDDAGNCYATGFFSGTATFGTTQISGNGYFDIFVAKYNSDGNLSWVRNAGGSSSDYGRAISTDSVGNSYVTGYFWGSAPATFGTIQIPNDGNGNEEIFITKLDSSGNFLWAKKAGGTSYDRGYAISTDIIGNCYVTGGFSGTATFGTTQITSSGGGDFFIAKYDLNGNFQWVQKPGGTSTDGGYAITAIDDGSVYALGEFEGMVTFGSTQISSIGNPDIFIVKYDVNGNFQWVQKAGGNGTQHSYGITADDAGNCYFTGRCSGNSNFGNIVLDAGGFISKLRPASLNTTSPIGGEVWSTNSVHNITWNSFDDGSIKIEITTNNGTNWIVVQNNVKANLGNYTFTVPPFSNSSECMIRLTSLSYGTISTSGLFTITSSINENLRITSPNTSLRWNVGSSQNITWVKTGNIENVKLEYTTDNGITWLTIIAATSASTESYNWTIPKTPSIEARVRISDATNPRLNDISDELFTIPYISIIAPTNGAKWKAETIRDIKWISTGVETYAMYFSTDNGSNWITMGGNSASNQIYRWHLPNIASADCRIKMVDAYDHTVFSVSEKFEIWRPLSSIQTPESGQVSLSFDSTNLTFSAFVVVPAPISVTFNWNDSSTIGDLPAGILSAADYHWVINASNLSFINGVVSAPVNSLFVENSSKLKWLKRENSNSPWLAIGGIIEDGLLKSTIPFNEFSEFTIGTIDSTRPGVVELSSPANNSINQNTELTFSWESEQLSVLYHLQVSTDSSFTNIVYNNKAINTNNQTVPSLAYLTTYYWRVRGVNLLGEGDWSDVWNTTTIIEKPANFILSAPTNNSKGLLNPVTVTWTSSARAEKYILQIATDSTFATFVVNDSAQTDLAEVLQTLNNYTQYYWRVKSVNMGGQSDWTEVWNFKTLGNPYASTLYIPANNSVNQPINGLVFRWSKAKERIETIQKYQFQLAMDAQFANLVHNDTTLTDTTQTVNGLSNLTKYYWRVRSQNQTGWGDWSEVWNTTTIIEIPANFTLSAPANNSKGLLNPVTVSWSASPRAEKYILQVSMDSSFATFVVNDSAQTDLAEVLSTLNNYTQYYWRVRSVNVGGQSDWTEVRNFRTLGNPYASTLFAPANNSVNQPLAGLVFKWGKAKERIETIQKYQLQLATDAQFTNMVQNDSTLTDTTKTLSGLSYLTKYYWRVRAQNQTGWGDWSEVWNTTTIIEKPANFALSAPANNSKGLLKPVTVTWNSSARAEKYMLQVSTDSTFATFVVNDSTQIDLTEVLPTLNNYTQYYWRVKSVNVGGQSEWSEVWNFKTLGNPYASTLFAPANNSVNQPIPGLVFKWSKAKERIETIQKYQLQLATDAQFNTIVQNDSTLTDTTKTVNSLNYLTKYYWRVRAQNQTGWGDWSEVWNTTTIIEKPANFTLSAPANNSKGLLNPVTVTWNSSARAEKYILQVSTDSNFATFVLNDSAQTDLTEVLPTLNNYTQYYWRVKSVNVGGESDWAPTWNFKTLGNPYASTLYTPANNSVNQPIVGLVFKWSKAKERIEIIQKYQFQLATDAQFTSIVQNDSTLTDTTKTLNILSYLTKYYWRVRAQNQTGWGDWSEFWNTTTIVEKPANFTLSTPANFSKGLPNPVTVSWSASARAERYILQVSSDSTFATLVVNDSAQTDLTGVLPTLNNHTQYYWRVKSVNTGGQSDWTPVWSFKTLGNPYASVLYTPANNSVNQPVTGLVFSWSRAKERIETIQKYQMQISTDSLFTGLILNDSTLTDTTKIMNGLSYLTRYHWRVRAQNQTGWGDWSDRWTTTTIIEKPAITVLASPAHNAAQLLQPVILKWHRAPRADIYRLEVSESSNFSSLVLVDSTLTDTLKVLPQLEAPKTYYWRVRSSNIGGVSDYSAVWNFRTLGKPLTVTLAAPANNSTHLPVTGVKLTWLKPGEQTMAPVGRGNSRNFRNDYGTTSSQLRASSKVAGLVSDGRITAGQGIEGGESILAYWLQTTSDTTGSIYIISDSTLADTFKVLPALNYLSSYYWRVKAKNENGWGAFSGWYRFTTIIERPSQPLLASPVNNALGLVQPVTVKWHSSLRAEKYALEVSTTANFTTVVHRDTSLTDTSKLLPVLGVYTKCYWRVTAKNAGGTSDTSAIFSFKTLGTPAGVALVTPSQNAQNIPVANILFNWTKAYDRIETILAYRFELKTDTAQSGYIVLDSLLTDTTKTVAQLQNQTVYYWRVGAKNEAGWSQPTAWSKFTTIVAAPGQVTLQQPANNAMSAPVRPLFKWNRIASAERYLIEVSVNQGFTSMVLRDSLVTDTVKIFIDSLLFNKKYYWRVKASNIGGQGSYSAVWNFTTLKRSIAAPANLTAVASEVKKVTLNWTDKSDNESGFIIFRKQGDSVNTNTLTAIDTSSANSVQYIDTTVATDPLLFSYRIIAYNPDTISAPSNYAVVLTLTDVTDRTNGTLPDEYSIQQNYPNPFNPSTTIRYGLPYDSDVRLEIYDISGQKLQTLVSETQSAGYYEAVFDISGMSSGTYLYILTATRLDGDGEFHQVKKMILLK